MATTTHKQKALTQLLAGAGKTGKAGEPAARPVLEQFLYALCREGVAREAADAAYENLRGRFFDWNEVRVSGADEVAEALAGLPDAFNRAQRVLDFLQEVFETTFSFDLESLHKKGLKQAAKQLGRYQAASDFVISFVLQQGLGGHALPLDEPMLRCLRRLAVIDEESDLETLRTNLEHQVPKAKGPLFVDVVGDLAERVCHADDPACPACPMNAACPVGQEVCRTASATSKKPR